MNKIRQVSSGVVPGQGKGLLSGGCDLRSPASSGDWAQGSERLTSSASLHSLRKARLAGEERRGAEGWRVGREHVSSHRMAHVMLCTPRRAPPTALVALGPVEVAHHQAVHFLLALLLLLPGLPAPLAGLLVLRSRALLHARAAVARDGRAAGRRGGGGLRLCLCFVPSRFGLLLALPRAPSSASCAPRNLRSWS